ncbi:Endonuclease MutS2 [Paraburkholderia hiiakae]|uniref:Endonuclease MutS2 n=1 Tax=Paraburkholderia hiiakae TaxID=1081782 RepID=A0ABM8P1B0_9BURK|nr:DNA mismatch repair protein MutS [Paraburkholderia hiiakae]CAD6553121.1 Endonuclease MutS2 [Paraburkholderia hiiakae]
MKAWLLYAERDFDWHRNEQWNERTLTQDLELTIIYGSMGAGDDFLEGVAKKVVPFSLNELDDILYRQAVLKDCLGHEATIRRLYEIAVDAQETERKSFYWGLTASATSVLHSARDLVQAYLVTLEKLRQLADDDASSFESPGFRRFFAMVRDELPDEYFATVKHCLKDLRLNGGVLISAQPGRGNKGTHYVLRKPHEPDPNLIHRLLARRPHSRTFRIAERDENGARAVSELEARGINHVANALAQSADHIKSFFAMLRAELGLYLGFINLRNSLVKRGLPVCFPLPFPIEQRRQKFSELYDVSLALRMDRAPVGNDADANGKEAIVVTGANQGGKSTFLRSIGIAQVLLQAGGVVGASAFEANVATGIITHYKREEDVTMKGGKFDEELSRMSEIIDHIRPHAFLLSNESFASTNEREGSEVGRVIIDALLEAHVKVCLVTHLFTLAKGLSNDCAFPILFLRAERREGGERTFRLTHGEPLQTSFGQDLYRGIFSEDIEESGGAGRLTVPS